MPRPFLFWGFKSSREILENSLGALEREVMDIAWREDEINVRAACEQLTSPAAYTTVMTTMDRLFKKGLLARR
jgi:predicted transcriptional regulator